MDMRVPHQLSLLMFLLNSWSRYTKPYTVLNQTLNYKEEKNKKPKHTPTPPKKPTKKQGEGKVCWTTLPFCDSMLTDVLYQPLNTNTSTALKDLPYFHYRISCNFLPVTLRIPIRRVTTRWETSVLTLLCTTHVIRTGCSSPSPAFSQSFAEIFGHNFTPWTKVIYTKTTPFQGLSLLPYLAWNIVVLQPT